MKPAGDEGCQPGGGVALRHLWQLLQVLALLLMVLLMGTLARRSCPLVAPWITGPLSAEGDRVVDGGLGLLRTGYRAVASHLAVGREP